MNKREAEKLLKDMQRVRKEHVDEPNGGCLGFVLFVVAIALSLLFF